MAFSNISSEATGQSVIKFYVEPSGAEGKNLLKQCRSHDQNGCHTSI